MYERVLNTRVHMTPWVHIYVPMCVCVGRKLYVCKFTHHRMLNTKHFYIETNCFVIKPADVYSLHIRVTEFICKYYSFIEIYLNKSELPISGSNINTYQIMYTSVVNM